MIYTNFTSRSKKPYHDFGASSSPQLVGPTSNVLQLTSPHKDILDIRFMPIGSWDLRVLEWMWCDILLLKDSALKGSERVKEINFGLEPGCFIGFLFASWMLQVCNGQPCGFNLQNSFLRTQESIQCFLSDQLRSCWLSLNSLHCPWKTLYFYKYLSFRCTVIPQRRKSMNILEISGKNPSNFISHIHSLKFFKNHSEQQDNLHLRWQPRSPKMPSPALRWNWAVSGCARNRRSRRRQGKWRISWEKHADFR